MIHIHATNLGVRFGTSDTTLVTAKDYDWDFQLSTEATSNDKDVIVLKMPENMALELFWEYCRKEASSRLLWHISALLDETPKEHIVEQLRWSVEILTDDRNNKVFGRVIKRSEAYMAKDIENLLFFYQELKLYALLDEAYFFQV